VKRNNNSSARAVLAQGYLLGGLLAAGLLTALLYQWHVPGTPVPPSLSTARFTVAVLAGPKQAAQQAPENADQKADAVKPAPVQTPAPVVTAERQTSLPKAVKAAQQAEPQRFETPKPVDVLPPAEVSMPGGHLVADDPPIGDSAQNPFEIHKGQVYIRLMVNSNGEVVRFGVVRSGGDQMRDSLILKAMRTRKYSTDKLIRVPGNEPLWQLDMVIDYGNNELLP
jgi:outer membrane biosynthesis protein TonB